ncbi:HlyD family efflux transporter periplasmic adaptor subunit [Dyadobacter sp. CY356]|uniref:HlyD family efflux transporter periplasmic adaptor subunit n=1 Tax=Dyadobacter sp. CY356 TaxID=2906442 RepID=UPI001F2A5925|nr:HlyD family efflux transporter periplasmic adaptor subunit [Dyadobacter sp. CY356]MCF0058526.1 HlyD family efflux transporter periplasmic adaptor subunit [Dyadobacter sp. CY356]
MEEIQDDIDLRSEAVRDFMDRPPKWLIRWGTLSLCFVLMVAFAVSWLIHYPTIVRADFRLISSNLPKPVVLKTDGRIEVLFVKENQSVKAGEILAYVESTSRHQEILDLEKELNQIRNVVEQNDFSKLGGIKLNSFEHLGEVQTPYQNFQQVYVQVRMLYADRFYDRKKKLLMSDIKRAELMDQQLNEQRSIYTRDSELADQEYKISKKLHAGKVIPDIEIYREESKALAKLLPAKNIETLRITNDNQKNTKINDLLELDRTVEEQTENFGQALNTLRSAIESWRSRYLLVSPQAGNVFFSTTLQEKQSLKAGVEVMYIGSGTSQYMGEIRIPQINSGRVNIGQRVLVKFQGYPFEEYGAVEGNVTSIAKVPSEDNTYFLATVSLPDGLKTNFNKSLVYKTGMAASAEIVTEDLRLIERLFYQIRRILLTR